MDLIMSVNERLASIRVLSVSQLSAVIERDNRIYTLINDGGVPVVQHDDSLCPDGLCSLAIDFVEHPEMFVVR